MTYCEAEVTGVDAEGTEIPLVTFAARIFPTKKQVIAECERVGFGDAKNCGNYYDTYSKLQEFSLDEESTDSAEYVMIGALRSVKKLSF